MLKQIRVASYVEMHNGSKHVFYEHVCVNCLNDAVICFTLFLFQLYIEFC